MYNPTTKLSIGNTMLITICPKQNNHYYVFIVRNAKNEIIFIGNDRLSHVTTLKKLLPHPSFDIDEVYTIEILTAHEKYFDAINTGNALISQLCKGSIPFFNKHVHYARIAKVQCIESGVIYQNASQAGQALDIPRPRLSMHLNNKPGHKHIKGLTFKYLIS